MPSPTKALFEFPLNGVFPIKNWVKMKAQQMGNGFRVRD